MRKLQARLAMFALLPLALALPTFAAAQDRDISLTADAAEPTRLKEVRTTLVPSAPETLKGTPRWSVPVRIGKSVIFDSMIFTAEWDDGTKTSVYLNIHSSLTRPPYYVYLAKPPATLDDEKLGNIIQKQCFERELTDPKDVFEQMQTCKAYALQVRGPDNNLGDRYLKALHGWYRANAYLYTVVPASIYALDPELVTRLRELMNVEQSIIKAADVRRTIVEFEAQIYRLATTVRSPTGEQEDQIRIAACKQLNEMTYPSYFRVFYGDPSNAERVAGIQQRHRQFLGLQRCVR